MFEYYPWYDTDPWFHWNDADHAPPLDVTASSMPRLGPYDTYDLRVLEQHARWIAEAGVGAINLSWWGRGDYTDLAVPRVMDVMRDHDIKVTFHLEPYRDDRSRNYADDLLFLLREYGEKRRWDTFLLLDDGNGRVAPVFKSFRTILPSQVQDCLGRIFAVPDYTADGDWRRQTDTAREETRRDFSRLFLLADSLAVDRIAAVGFDGLAVYDNFVTPPQWTRIAQDATDVGLLASFNVNPGFDRYPERQPPPPPEVDPCYGGPLGFEPGGTHPDWSDMQARIAAQDLALDRITRVVHRHDDPAAADGIGQRQPRLLPGLRQLVQRVARGLAVRTGQGLRRPDARRAPHRLPQPARRLRAAASIAVADRRPRRARRWARVAGWIRTCNEHSPTSMPRRAACRPPTGSAAPAGHWHCAQILEHLGKAYGGTAYILDKCVADGAPKGDPAVLAAAIVRDDSRHPGLSAVRRESAVDDRPGRTVR